MRVRKLGSGPLVTRAGTIHGGETADVPLDVVERYAHKLEILEALPQPEPGVPDRVSAPFDAAALTIAGVLDAVDAGAVTLSDAIASEEGGKARVTLLTELRDRVGRDAHQL